MHRIEFLQYEESTDDLRQVRHEEWAGDHLLVYYRIQRAWSVMESPYRYIRTEWRDLPEIHAAEVQREQEAQNQSTS